MTRLRNLQTEVEVVRGHDQLGEGPVWLASEQKLVWVDITESLIQTLDPATNHTESVNVGQPVGAVVPRTCGGFAVAVRDGFGTVEAGSGRLQIISDTEADNPDNRMNDGKCDGAGRFWAGTMAFGESSGAGSLYRLDTDHNVTKVLDNVSVSNGLGWSLDETLMYYIDSPTDRVDVFDYDPQTGEIRNRRPLVDLSLNPGVPDGMTVDSEGFLWVATFGGWSVRRYAPDGTPDLVIELPTSQITSCAFGGPDLRDLYITSARGGLSENQVREQPSAGALFRCRPGVAGLPANPFAG